MLPRLGEDLHTLRAAVAQLTVGAPTAGEQAARLRHHRAVVAAARQGADPGPVQAAGADLRGCRLRRGVAMAQPAIVAKSPGEEPAVGGGAKAMTPTAGHRGDHDTVKTANTMRLG